MTKISTPMLFCPPQPPIQLGPRDTVIIGRSRSCDLRLGGTDASRRHVEITGNAEGFTLFDLGSTNGTFVNGERVQEHALKPGDRIEIGASTITFCHVGGGLENMGLDSDSEKTMLVERPSATQVFEGELAEIPAFAVLQILEMGRKSGLLQCESEDSVGRLWLSDGRGASAPSPGSMRRLGADPSRNSSQPVATLARSIAIVGVSISRSSSPLRRYQRPSFALNLTMSRYTPLPPMLRLMIILL